MRVTVSFELGKVVNHKGVFIHIRRREDTTSLINILNGGPAFVMFDYDHVVCLLLGLIPGI